ncbi:MAG: hypothetical protein WD030_00840 [Pirellulales bacterium]
MLPKEEYIEQAYFFKSLGERLLEDTPSQEVLSTIKEEMLATTRLPMAIDFMASELRLHGVFATAMRRLSHYFTPFQTFVVAEGEAERGRFDLQIGLQILQREAEFRGGEPSPQGLFLFQFECLCRNRLGYDAGLKAVSEDPIFNEDWKSWILKVRQQVGIVDICDMIYVRSELYRINQARQAAGGAAVDSREVAVLFGEKEGRIAWANRRKDPIYLFNAFHRQLGYPAVPRPKAVDESVNILPRLVRQMERLEHRIRLLEEENRGGIHIEKFFGDQQLPPPPGGKELGYDKLE